MVNSFIVTLIQCLIFITFVILKVRMAIIHYNQSTISVKAVERIVNHECFSRTNMDECHEANQTLDLQCLWCEYWCVHKLDPFHRLEGCYKYSDEFSEFYSKPQIIDIKPKVIFNNTPTMVNIYGSHFYDNSEHVYNRIHSILFNQQYECQIIFINYSLIHCLLDGLNNSAKSPFPITMRFSFNRLVFGLDESNVTDLDNKIFILKSSDDYDWLKMFDKENDDDGDHHPLDSFPISLQGVVGAILGVTGCILILFIVKKRQTYFNLSEAIKRHFFIKKMKKQLIKENLLAEYRSIEYRQKLGKGNFGEVYLALATDSRNVCSEIAVKRLRKSADTAKMKLFITEGIQMSKFTNERILTTVAIFYDDHNSTPAIVLPVMTNGDLCRYLRQAKEITLFKLSNFAYQISEGMEYLSSINMVHGDLAARNCLLDSNFDIKIGDFGMTRSLYRADYVILNDIYRPIRWMAIECLINSNPKFTIKTDVWSFGVVLWEIFTHGLYPYDEFDDADLSHQILNGFQLHKPHNCPNPIYELMQQCWSFHSENRPTFQMIKQRFKEFLANDSEDINDENGNSLKKIIPCTYQPSLRKEIDYTTLSERFVVKRPSGNIDNVIHSDSGSDYYSL